MDWRRTLTKEEVEGTKGDRLQHTRGDKGDNEVCQPIGCDSDTHCLASDAWREHLTWHDPIDATNGKGEIRDVQPDEDGSCPSSRAMRGPGIFVDGEEGTDDEL